MGVQRGKKPNAGRGSLIRRARFPNSHHSARFGTERRTCHRIRRGLILYDVPPGVANNGHGSEGGTEIGTGHHKEGSCGAGKEQQSSSGRGTTWLGQHPVGRRCFIVGVLQKRRGRSKGRIPGRNFYQEDREPGAIGGDSSAGFAHHLQNALIIAESVWGGERGDFVILIQSALLIGCFIPEAARGGLCHLGVTGGKTCRKAMWTWPIWPVCHNRDQ